MKNTKLFTLFTAMSRSEQHRFSRYVGEQYVGKEAPALRLYNYLKRKRLEILKEKEASSAKITKESLFKICCPKEKYNAKKMTDLMAELSQHIQAFWLREKLNADPVRQHLLMADIYWEKQLTGLFTGELKKALSFLEAQPYRDSQYFQLKQEVSHSWFFHPQTEDFKEIVLHLHSAQAHLDSYAQLNLKRYACELKIRELLIDHDHSPKEEEAINPLLLFYTQLNIVLDKPSLEGYKKLEKTVKDCLAICRLEEQQAVLTFMINLVGLLAARKKIDVAKESFKWYKYGLENQILMENGSLAQDHFLNAITVSGALGERDWALNFIVGNKKKLAAENRDSIFHLSMAIVLFSKKEYQEAISHLIRVKYKNVSLALRGYSLEIRCYFELALLGEDHLCEESLRNFKAYLQRESTLAKHIKKANLNFALLVGKLLATLGNPVVKWAQLEKLLQGVQPIIAQQWLVEKWKELNKPSSH